MIPMVPMLEIETKKMNSIKHNSAGLGLDQSTGVTSIKVTASLIQGPKKVARNKMGAKIHS